MDPLVLETDESKLQCREESTWELVDEEGLPETKEMQSRSQQISVDEEQMSSTASRKIAFCSLEPLSRGSETISTFEGVCWEANFLPPPLLILHSEQVGPLIWNLGNLHIIIPSVLVYLNLEVHRAQRSISGAHDYQSGYPSCQCSAHCSRRPTK